MVPLSDQIAGYISECGFEAAKFLIISNNIDVPLIYYSHLSAVLILAGLVVISLFRTKIPFKTSFRITALAYIFWLLGDVILWANEQPDNVMFYWSLINLVEPLIFAGAFWMTVNFIRGRQLKLVEQIGIYLLLLPTIVLSPSYYSLPGFDATTCDRNAVEGVLAYYNYGIEFLFLVLILIYGGTKIASVLKNRKERDRIALLLGGIVLMLGSFLIGNFLGTLTGEYEISQFGHLGVPLFATFLGYVIIRFESLNPKVLGFDALVFALLLLMGSIFFVSSIEYIRIILMVTLVLSTPVAVALLRGVRHEIQIQADLEKQAAQLEILNNRLKELDKQKSEFVSIASHQLRAPLGAVRGYASLILEGSFGKPPENLVEPLERIGESTRNMANTIEDFLNISRIELGRMKYDIVQFDLTDLVQTVVNELKPIAEDKGLKITFEKAEPIIVTADSGKVKQVITNLTDNAVKYTLEGSVVVSMKKEAGKVQIRIKDSGIGMDTETLNGIFEKFVRGRESRHVNITGTGLGLYIAKQLIEGNKGRVWAESEGKDKGSTFIIELPA